MQCSAWLIVTVANILATLLGELFPDSGSFLLSVCSPGRYRLVLSTPVGLLMKPEIRGAQAAVRPWLD